MPKTENGKKQLQRRETVADGGTVPCLLIQNGAALIRHRLAKEVCCCLIFYPCFDKFSEKFKNSEKH